MGVVPDVFQWFSIKGIPLQKFDFQTSALPPNVAADIAASTQKMFSASVINVIETAETIAGAMRFDHEVIALSGGCALNCPTNSEAAMRFGKKVAIPPAVNDEGNSVGAALACAHIRYGERPRPPGGLSEIAYKGRSYEIGPSLREKATKYHTIQGDPASALAAALADGATAGVFYGEAEIGPRALGHRSIVASPLLADNWRKLNVIKSRELWRPFAPMVLDEDVHRYFEGCPSDSYYMLFNAKVISPELPAITHRDGSSRIQVVNPQCGFVHALLLAFRALTGHGVLINTSFNGRGEPIVETPEDALAAFDVMLLDYLYLQGALLARARKHDVIPTDPVTSVANT